MAQNVENMRVLRRIRGFAVVAAFAIIGACLFACSPSAQISFSTDGIVLYVGETRDIFPYVVLSASDDRNSVFFEADSQSCITLSGSSVSAVAAGRAVVTAFVRGKPSATLDVTVKYRNADSLTITHDGELCQNLKDGESPSLVRFGIVRDEYGDPEIGVDWYVDGVCAAAGDAFEFTPRAFGSYRIFAKAGNASCDATVNVYRATDATAYADGELVQSGDRSPVVFTAVEQADTRNPRSVYEWRINGEAVSHDAVFAFTPESVGEYRVSLYVNGVRRDFAEERMSTVTVSGERAPIGEVVFDDRDGVFIEWRDGGYINSVTVVSSDGKRTKTESSDIRHSYRFGRGVFDATDIIDVCGDGAYTVRLEAEGKGEQIEFVRYPESARRYIEEKIYINNGFLSDAEQAERLVLEMYARGIKKTSAYLARELSAEAADLTVKNTALAIGSSARTAFDGDVMTVELSDYYNKPRSTAKNDAERLFSELPHIEYAADNLRASEYVLAIERNKNTVAAENSEQLLLAVLGGVRPQPTVGTAAVVYCRARAVLLSVIGKDYDEWQKVHAIYDWLVWSASRAEGAVPFGSSADFAESVFGGEGMTANGVVSSLGAAKSFALLCGMDGLECRIVSCGGNADDARKYYWNKVKLGGVWYNVDVFGAKSNAEQLGVSPRNIEMGSHGRFLLSDAAAASLGLLTDGSYAAPFDGRSYYLEKHRYGDVYFDYCLDKSEYNDIAAVKAAVSYALENGDIGSYSIFGVNGTVTVSKAFYGMQWYLGDADGQTVENFKAVLTNAVREYCKHTLDSDREAVIAFYPTVNAPLKDGVLHVNILLPLVKEVS